MAQPIHCDYQGMEAHPADVMVSQIANGDTTAWCFGHYVDVCQAVLDTAAETIAQAQATDQEAASRLEGVTAPDQANVTGEAVPAAPTSPDDPAGPDGGPGGSAGDESTEAGLASPAPDDQAGAPAATAGA